MFEADETEDMQSLWEEDGLLTMQEVSYADPRAQQTPAEFFESLGLSASAAAALAETRTPLRLPPIFPPSPTPSKPLRSLKLGWKTTWLPSPVPMRTL